MFGLRQAAVIGAIGFLAGAAWMETHNAPADKVVIIDGWWSKDYPKSSCGSITAPTNSFSTADERAGCAMSHGSFLPPTGLVRSRGSPNFLQLGDS
jgi:hypothetical protein